MMGLPWESDPIVKESTFLNAAPAASAPPGGKPLGPGGAVVPNQPGVVSGPLSTSPRVDEDTFHTATPQEIIEKHLDPAQPYKINDRTGEPTAVGARREDVPAVKTPDELGGIRDEAIQKIILARSLRQRSKERFLATGAGSAAVAGLPFVGASTPAGGVAKDTATLKAAGALERTMQLARESGGKNPLTPISEADFRALGESISNLDPAQEDDQFQHNATVVESNYLKAYQAAGGGDIEADIKAYQERLAALDAADKGGAAIPPGTVPAPMATINDPSGRVRPEDQAVLQDNSPGKVAGLDTGTVGEEGGFHTVTDPSKAGMNATLSAMLTNKAIPLSDIKAYLEGKGISPAQVQDMMAQVLDRRKWLAGPGKNFKGTYPVDVEKMTVPNSGIQNFVASDVGAGLTGYTDAALGFSIDNFAGLLGKDPEEVRTALDASRAAHPASTTVGNIAGGLTTAIAGEAGLSALGAGKFVAPVAADLGYGTVSGAMATDVNPETGEAATLGDRALGALKGAGAAAVGTAVGRTVTGIPKVLGSKAGNATARVLNEADVPTTLGSQYGGKWKQFEDWIRGQPGGGAVKDRQIESIKKFNERTFDKVLKSIGVRNPDGLVGSDAVRFAQDQIAKQYDKALTGKVAPLTDDWAIENAASLQAVQDLPTIGPEVLKRIDTVTAPHLQNGEITGEGMQTILEELRDIKNSYHTSGNAQAYEIGKAIDGVEESIFDAFRKSKDPALADVVAEYNKAQIAYKRLNIASEAVLKGKKQGGVFMPGWLIDADTAAAKRSGGKISAAGKVGKGERHFGTLSEAAQDRLVSKLPDSGTARFLIPSVLLAGSGATTIGGEAVDSPALSTAGKMLGLAAILSGAYTKTGQRILTKPGRGITNPTAARAARVVGEKTQNVAGHGGAAEATGLRQARIEREERERREKKKAAAGK